MLAATTTASAFALVALGIAFQLATLARVGTRIVRTRRSRRAAPASRSHPATLTPKTARVPARRRCRDYRTAVRAVR